MVGAPKYSPVVRLLADKDLEPRFDLLLFAIGYEERSGHVAREYQGRYMRAIAVRFGLQEELSFRDNLDWAEAGDSIDVRSFDSEVVLGATLAEFVATEKVLHIAVDVSSFPRPYLAAVVSALWEVAKSTGTALKASFFYSVPEYSAPPVEHGPVVSFGAVHPQFAGAGAGHRGLATLIGLGYEPNLALAAQQVLDPAETWLALPRSSDQNFDVDVSSSNEVLLDVVDSSFIWSYDVDSPGSTFIELEAIVSGLAREYNVVLVPLGPKLFAVICMLVSLVHGQESGVWRLSAGGLRIPRQQIAAGPIANLSVEFLSPVVD